MTSTKKYTKQGMMRAIRLIEEFRKIYPDMQMQQANVFLTIAANPGITMKDLGQRTGLAQSSCSRNVALLGEWLKHNKPGYGLVVAEEDPVERRRKIVKLTAKGERVAEAVDLLMTTES